MRGRGRRKEKSPLFLLAKKKMPTTTAAGVGLANPADALAAAARGGAFLFLDVPPGTAFVIDGQAFIAGPHFKGIKMVPPGPHLVSYAAREAGTGAPGLVTSFWAWVDVVCGSNASSASPTPQSIVIRRWDPATELLAPVGDEDEAARLSLGVACFDFDAGLAPYALRSWAGWRALAGHIDRATIARSTPPGIPGGNVSVVAEADPGGVGGLSGGVVGGGGGPAAAAASPRPPTAAEAALESALEAGRDRSGRVEQEAGSPPPATLVGVGVGVPRYTPLPRLVVAGEGTTAAALTAANLDKSGALAAIIAAPPFNGDAGAGLLAELQHAFLSFWAGQCLAAFGAWKAALHLALGCVAAPRRPATAPFFASLLTALAAQLEASLGGGGRGGEAASPGGKQGPPQPPGGDGPFGVPMADELLADSFLRALVKRFYGHLREAGPAPVPADVSAAAAGLAAVVRARLGWEVDGGEGEDDEDDDDDDGPVVVGADGSY